MSAYEATDFWKPITISIKKTLRRTQISCSYHSAPKTLKALKKLGIKEKTRDTKEEIVEMAIFVSQCIEYLLQQLGSILVRFYLQIARIYLEKKTKTWANLFNIMIIRKKILQIDVPKFFCQKLSGSYNNPYIDD